MSFPAVKDSLSSMVLSGLPLVILDTETTGLDTKTARMVEIGACRAEIGQNGVSADRYEAFVQPGIPIPDTSTAIHGIKDADVSEAPAFPEAMSSFIEWCGPCVVIGYSIGFDMAIMKAEHERHKMIWRPPRCLDIRHLVQVLAPNLPNPSLETTAAWLEVDVSDRHRALGDALVTAAMFQALVPRLQKAGIKTLAEAERACRGLTEQRTGEARAGWDGLPENASGVKGYSDFARIDSFPYRHLIGDLMSSPPLTMHGDSSISEALTLLLEKKVSSVLIRDADGAQPTGILTERDILRAIGSGDAKKLDRPVREIASFPLVAVDAGEFVSRALSKMSAKGFRHLAVSDGQGAIVGVLSARDLLKQRAGDAVSLADEIADADTAESLGKVWSNLTKVAQALVYEGVDGRSVASLISRELRALTERSCEIAAADMEKQGLGKAPQPFSMMVLGSGGRGESLLAMDQDNAIVFEEGDPGGEADAWFAELGRRVSDILDASGVSYCKGGIMAANAEWRMDADRWQQTVGGWMDRARPEDILNCDIFFDACPVYGDPQLTDRLKELAVAKAAKSKPFLRALALNAGRFDSPVGWFGRLKLTDGRIDLKLHGIMPIFSTARVAALERGLTARSTPDRLTAVLDTGNVSKAAIENLIEAHRVLLNLILEQQLRDIAAGLPPSNTVAPAELGEVDKQELQWALDQVPRVADILGTPMVG